MNTDERIIELLQEQNRLLSILVAPIVSLQSKQLAKMTPEEIKAHNKSVIARAKERLNRGRK